MAWLARVERVLALRRDDAPYAPRRLRRALGHIAADHGALPWRCRQNAKGRYVLRFRNQCTEYAAAADET